MVRGELGRDLESIGGEELPPFEILLTEEELNACQRKRGGTSEDLGG